MSRLVLWLLVIVVWLGFVLTIATGCADMPRGKHGERLAINHGWLEVAQVSARCLYEQREYALRVRCVL